MKYGSISEREGLDYWKGKGTHNLPGLDTLDAIIRIELTNS